MTVTVVESEVPLAMRKVYRRLQHWRRQRKGRERIPQRLWIAAGELAREHGVNPVSRALGLDFNRLKRMTESKGAVARKRRGVPSFVELIAPPAAGSPRYVTFPGNRPPASGQHHRWDELFMRVD